MNRLNGIGFRSDRFVGLVVAKWVAARWFLVIVAAVIFVFFAPWSRQLEMNRQVDGMFPPDDDAASTYRFLKQHFGGNAIVLLVFRDPQLLTPEGVRRVGELGDSIKTIPGVRDTLTLHDVSRALQRIRVLSFSFAEIQPAVLEDSEIAAAFRDMFSSYTHNQSGTHGAVVVMLEPDDDGQNYKAAIERLQAMVTNLPPPLKAGALVGQPVLVTTGFSLIQRDGQRLNRVTVGLMGLVLLLVFRSLRWPILALTIVAWAVVVTEGTAVLSGLRLSLVSSMLTAVLTVVAVASVVHVATAWQRYRRRKLPKDLATQRTLRRLLPPIVWAAITDAVGFAALLASRVGPVRDFGLLTASGVGLVLLAFILLTPAALSLPAPTPLGTGLLCGWDRYWRSRLVRLTAIGLRYRVFIGGICLLLFAVFANGLTRLRGETNFLRNFRENSTITQAYRLVESDFGGAGVWDILLPVPAGVIREDYLQSVSRLESQLLMLRNPRAPEARILKTLSLADANAAALRSGNPLVQLASPEARLAEMRNVIPTFSRALLMPADGDQRRFLRIMLRSPEDLSTAAKAQLIDQVRDQVQQHTRQADWQLFFADDSPEFPSTGLPLTPAITGYYVLLADLVKNLLEDQWICFVLAIFGLFTALVVMTGRMNWALLALIPNISPILLILAAIGWSGRPLNMGGAMIAAVSIGLTIDGTIHFLSVYRRVRIEKKRSAYQAVLRAQGQVGVPIMLATLTLICGFSVLTISDFLPTATFGWMLSIAMLLGMLTNFGFLPLLLCGRSSALSRLPSIPQFTTDR